MKIPFCFSIAENINFSVFDGKSVHVFPLEDSIENSQQREMKDAFLSREIAKKEACMEKEGWSNWVVQKPHP
jgi:hypothetical protein